MEDLRPMRERERENELKGCYKNITKIEEHTQNDQDRNSNENSNNSFNNNAKLF